MNHSYLAIRSFSHCSILRLMKQFVKVLEKGACLEYICKAFPGVITEKLKNGTVQISENL